MATHLREDTHSKGIPRLGGTHKLGVIQQLKGIRK